MVSTLYGDRQIFEAAFVASPDVFWRDVVTSRENPISDSCQIDLDALRTNVDQHDLEPATSRLKNLGHPPRIVIFDYFCTVCVTDAELSAMSESPL